MKIVRSEAAERSEALWRLQAARLLSASSAVVILSSEAAERSGALWNCEKYCCSAVEHCAW